MECEYPYCPACDEDRKRELTAALDAAQDEIEKLIADKEALRERLEWEQPEPDGDVRPCDGSMVGCPPGDHSHIGGVGRGGAS